MSALPDVLRDMAEVSEAYSMADVARFPSVELETARDDVRGVDADSPRNFYEATGWVYGPKSFGLRLAAWWRETRPQTREQFFRWYLRLVGVPDIRSCHLMRSSVWRIMPPWYARSRPGYVASKTIPVF